MKNIKPSAEPDRTLKETALPVGERQLKVDQQIEALNSLGLNSPAFWERLDVKAEPPTEPEVLFWAAVQFARSSANDRLQQVFEILYNQYNSIIEDWINKNVYVKYASDDKKTELRVEVSQEIWADLLNSVQTARSDDAHFTNFDKAILYDVRSFCKKVVRRDGGPVTDRIHTVERTDASGRSYQDKEYVRAPANRQHAWDAQVGQASSESHELTFADLIGDTSWQPDKLVEPRVNYDALLRALKNRLDEEQIQILLMRADGWNYVQIGQYLGRDRETISRRLAKIQGIARQVAASFNSAMGS